MAVEDTVSKAELLDLVRGLHPVRAAIEEIFHGIITGNLPLADAQAAIRKVHAQMGAILLSETHVSPLFRLAINAPLTAEQYILPQPLHELHTALLEHVKSKNTVKGFPYTGLLLHGAPGMGKSEYAYHLADAARDDIVLVEANIPSITHQQNPPLAIRQLYEELEAFAEKLGKFVVVLFDEFDSLIREFTHSETTVRTDDQVVLGAGIRESTTERSTMNIDKTGAAILAELKSVLSGTGQRRKVVTLATTNSTNFPPALVRHGRLKAVKFLPIRLGDGKLADTHEVENVTRYGAGLTSILELLQASCIRSTGTPSPVIASCAEDWQKLVLEAEREVAAKVSDRDRNFSVRDSNDKTNAIWCCALLKFAGCDIKMESLLHYMVVGRKVSQSAWTNAAVAGLFLENRTAFTTNEACRALLIQELAPFIAKMKSELAEPPRRPAGSVRLPRRT